MKENGIEVYCFTCKKKDEILKVSGTILGGNRYHCERCNQEVYPELLKNMEEIEKANKWQEEFEDEIYFDWERLDFKNHITEFYVKDGLIQIERIK